jgi:membrane fusion protein (multidrug efflux system)
MADTPEPKLAPPPRKKKAIRAYAVLGLLAGAVVAIYFIHGYLTRDQVATDDAQVDADVVTLSSRVTGVVLKLHATDNQEVKAGELLAEIDPGEYDLRVASAEKELEIERAKADSADRQLVVVTSASKGGYAIAQAQKLGANAAVSLAGSQVQSQAAALARAKTELVKAQGDYDRAKKLHDAGAITGQQFDAATATRDSAAEAVDQAVANLNGAREQQAAAQTRVAEAVGRVEQSGPVADQVAAAAAAANTAHANADKAEKDLELAKQTAGWTKIVAPTDGYVSKLAAREGQMVQPGSVICMVVPKVTYVIANFKETQIERIRPGDDVDIKLDALGGTRHGKVASVAMGTGARFSMLPPDNATGNFVKVVQRVPVKINWATPQDGAALQAGLSAEVTVHLHLQ